MRKETTRVQIASTLIVMRGYPGTGKSTIAREIARAVKAVLIDKDIIRQTAVDVLGDRPDIGDFAYELMFALTREQLKLGLSVVFDTPLTYYRTYEQAHLLAQSFHIPMQVIHCQCPPEIQKRRLEGRKGMVSTFQITSWEEWQHWKPRFEEYGAKECVIDTSHPISVSLAKVLEHLHMLHYSSDCEGMLKAHDHDQ